MDFDFKYDEKALNNDDELKIKKSATEEKLIEIMSPTSFRGTPNQKRLNSDMHLAMIPEELKESGRHGS